MPDLLPPMVVLEILRLGRRKVVTGALLITQLLFAFLVTAQMIQPEATPLGAWFWMVAIIAVLVATPLLAGWRGREGPADISARELLIVARLSSWQQVTGRWLALCLLSGAQLAGLVPWLMLRWLAIGVFIEEEWLALGLMALLVPMLNALWVVISGPGASPLTRALPTVFLTGSAFGAWHLANGLIRHGRDVFGGNLLHAMSYPQFWPALAMLPPTCLLLLWLAANRLARDHERPSLQWRLGLVLLIFMFGAFNLTDLATPTHTGVAILALLLVAACQAVIERPRIHPGLTAGFDPRSLPSRLAARTLAPGNYSAGPYMLILIAAATVAWPAEGALGLTRWSLAIVGAAGLAILLWGVIIDRLLFKHQPPNPVRMLAIQAVMWSVAALLAYLDSLPNPARVYFSDLLPTTLFLHILGWPTGWSGTWERTSYGWRQVRDIWQLITPQAMAAMLLWAVAALAVDHLTSRAWWRAWWRSQTDDNSPPQGPRRAPGCD